jgi:hypothetical protein
LHFRSVLSKTGNKAHVVAHPSDLSSPEAEQESQEFKASLG